MGVLLRDQLDPPSLPNTCLKTHLPQDTLKLISNFPVSGQTILRSSNISPGTSDAKRATRRQCQKREAQLFTFWPHKWRLSSGSRWFTAPHPPKGGKWLLFSQSLNSPLLFPTYHQSHKQSFWPCPQQGILGPHPSSQLRPSGAKRPGFCNPNQQLIWLSRSANQGDVKKGCSPLTQAKLQTPLKSNNACLLGVKYSLDSRSTLIWLGRSSREVAEWLPSGQHYYYFFLKRKLGVGEDLHIDQPFRQKKKGCPQLSYRRRLSRA